MLFVVDDDEEPAEKEGGEDIAEDDFPLEIVEVRHEDVDEGGEAEEDSTEAAADGVGQSEGPAVLLEASLCVGGSGSVSLAVLITPALHHDLHDLPFAGDGVIQTKVVFKSRLRMVERPVGYQKVSAGPGLHHQSLTLLTAVKEVVAQTEVGEAAAV